MRVRVHWFLVTNLESNRQVNKQKFTQITSSINQDGKSHRVGVW